MIATKTTPMSTADALRAQGVEYLWHMTHIANLDTVMRYGLLSHNEARNSGMLKQDISDSDVQCRRAAQEPVNGKSMHSYVPFYVNPKNAMLYRRQEIQHDICILGVSLDALENACHVFTDGNAACDATWFSNHPEDVEFMPWEVLQAPRWNTFIDGKRLRCAEVMQLGKVAPEMIRTIHLYDRTHMAYAAKYGKQLVDNSCWYF